MWSLRRPGTIASPNKGNSNSYILTNSHNNTEVKLWGRLERKKITTIPPHPTTAPGDYYAAVLNKFITFLLSV
jgi:hypothetical protein